MNIKKNVHNFEQKYAYICYFRIDKSQKCASKAYARNTLMLHVDTNKILVNISYHRKQSNLVLHLLLYELVPTGLCDYANA